MATVTNTIKLPDGTTPSYASVVIELVASTTSRAAGWIAANDTTILSVARPTVTAGAWTASLTPNADITPSGTVYKVTETADKVRYIHYISVGSGGGTVHDLLVDAPDSLPSAPLTDHIADTAGAHAASAISHTPTGALVSNFTSTTVQAVVAELEAKLPRLVPAGATTAQIEAVMAAVATAGGGRVLFSAGNFHGQTAAIRVPSNTLVEGMGYATHIKLAAAANCDVITNRDWVTGNSNIVVRNLRLDGDRTNQTSAVGDGPGQSCVSFINCTYSMVDTVWCENPFLHGVDFGVRNESGNPDDDPGCQYCVVRDCVISNFGDDGVTTHYSSQLDISGCLIRDAAATYSGGSNGIEIDDGSFNVTVTNCIALNCVAGFKLQAHTNRPAAYNVSFVNCQAISPTSSGFLFASQTSPSVYGYNVSVVGGLVYDAPGAAVRINHYREVVVTGLLIDQCPRAFDTVGAVDAGTTTGLRFTNCEINGGGALSLTSSTFPNVGQVFLTGLTIRNLSAASAVNIQIPNVVMKDCVVESCTNVTGGGIHVTTGASLVQVIDNVVRNMAGSSASGIKVSAGSDILIARNLCEDNPGGGGNIYINSGATIDRVAVVNNICNGGSYGIRNQAAAGSGYISGNIISEASTSAIGKQHTGGTWTVANNLGDDI